MTVASYRYGASRRMNELPWVITTSTPRRFITGSAADKDYNASRLMLRVGSGAP